MIGYCDWQPWVQCGPVTTVISIVGGAYDWDGLSPWKKNSRKTKDMVSPLLSKIRTKSTKLINDQPVTEAWRGSLPCWGHGTSWAEARMWPLVFWRLAVLAPDQKEQWGKGSSHVQGVLPTKMLSVPAQHTTLSWVSTVWHGLQRACISLLLLL